jgi:hypothetical protein
VSLAVGAEVLHETEALEDLHRLHEQLRLHYAGYADLDWTLQEQGSSWSERTAAFEQRIRDRGELTWNAFFDLLADYLAPVQDTHFQMTGSGSADGTITSRRAAFVHSLAPFFADLRIRDRDGVFIVTEAAGTRPGLPGSEVVGLQVVGTPHAVEPGVPCLFPTLPSKPDSPGTPSAGEFLLGVLAGPADPPGTITVRLRSVPGASPGDERASGKTVEREVRLPLHRGRALRQRRGTGWGVATPPATPIALLAVRTMIENLLDGMAASADTLRHLSPLVLDLRRNGGGSDRPAMQWCQRFSGQPYEWIARVARRPGRTDPLRAWMSFPGDTRSRIAGPSVPAAPEPYPGRLFVLMDKGVASSGETFAQLAGQVRGAVSVGENTAGCVNYGNVESHEPLPHSRIHVDFGRSRFVVDWVRPNREGVGFFPDYWLDTEDPVTVIAAYAEGSAKASKPASPGN